jgi:tetratricopeptide (TPR) repeat protein
LAKQDEKLRLRKRLQEQAIDLASSNRWDEAVEVNQKLIEISPDAETFNRLGKAYMELARYTEAHDAYQQTLRIAPGNVIARKQAGRLEALLSVGNGDLPAKEVRQQVDLRLFITETGKTGITTLIDVPRTPAVDALAVGEKVEIKADGRSLQVFDVEGNNLGRVEPKLGQRLAELITGGNRYTAAVAQTEGRQVRVLIRETFQDPSQRDKISFPGKLGDVALRPYVPAIIDYDMDEMLEDDDSVEEAVEAEEDYIGGDEEDELGLDQIEKDIGEDDDMGEE